MAGRIEGDVYKLSHSDGWRASHVPVGASAAAFGAVRAIDLKHCRITAAMLQFLENHCTGLEEIYLSHCSIPEDERYGLVQLIAHPNMKNIKHVHLHDSTIGGVWLGSEIPLVQTREPSGGAVRKAEAMDTLVIQNDRLSASKTETSALGGLLRLCPNLRRLHLRMECDSVYLPEIQRAIHRLSNLEVLEIGTFGILIMTLLSGQPPHRLDRLAILDVEPGGFNILALDSGVYTRHFTCNTLTLEYEVSRGMRPVDVSYIAESFGARTLNLRIGARDPSVIMGQYSIDDLKKQTGKADAPIHTDVRIFKVTGPPVELLARGRHDLDNSSVVVPSTSEREPGNWESVLPFAAPPISGHWTDSWLS